MSLLPAALRQDWQIRNCLNSFGSFFAVVHVDVDIESSPLTITCPPDCEIGEYTASIGKLIGTVGLGVGQYM